MSCSRILILFTVLLMILAGGCTIGRVYIGSEIKHDPKREKEVLRRLKIRNRGPLKEKDLEKVFRTIMKVCRRFQKVVNSEVPL